MDLVESLRMSWRSIRGHPLRSTLTTLGVIIGVAAVIVFVTLGTSLQAEIVGDVAGQREPVMSAWAGPEGAEGGPGAGAQPVFTESDIAAINATAGVNQTLPRGTVGPATLTRGSDTIIRNALVAVPPEYFEGTGFVAGEAYASGERTIVVNQAAAALFGGNDSMTGAAGGFGVDTNESVGTADGPGAGLPGNISIGELRNLSREERAELRNATASNESIAAILQRIANESTTSTRNRMTGADTASAPATTTAAPPATDESGSTATAASTNTTGVNASGGNLSVGEEVVVDLDDRTITATVAGITNDTALGAFGAGFGDATPQFYVPPDPFYDTTVVAPDTGERERVYPLLTVTASGFERVGPTQDRVRSYLRNESDARALVPDSYVFNVRTNEQLLDQIREIIGTLTDFIVAIAAISLLVGSIGIANIMLVSVTERTREIGIMKATGARRRDVLQLFLVEAVLLGVIGSALGAALGVLGGYGLTAYVELPLVLDPWLFAGAIAVGIGVGVVAGVYPAWRAARTDPIDALRYE